MLAICSSRLLPVSLAISSISVASLVALSIVALSLDCASLKDPRCMLPCISKISLSSLLV